MVENAGKMEVEYVVQSDAAVRHLAQIEKHMMKIVDAAEKQEKAQSAAFKKAGKSALIYKATIIGMLYGIIKASSYAAMWMDQIGHSLTRIFNVILKVTGLQEAIDGIVSSLGLLADELENPDETDFWAELAEDFDNLSLKGKMALGALVALGLWILKSPLGKLWGVIKTTWKWFGKLVTKIKPVITWLGRLLSRSRVVRIAIYALRGALLLIGGVISTVGLLLVGLALSFVYLWSKTEHGKAQIESLINIWENFKTDIRDVGWLRALGNAIEDIGRVLWFELFYWIKLIPSSIRSYFETSVFGVVYGIGIKVVNALVDGMDSIFPGFKAKWNEFWDWLTSTLTNLATTAYVKGVEIVNWLIDGIDSKLPGFRTVVNYLGNIFGMEGDAMIVAAKADSAAMTDGWIDGVKSKNPMAAIAAHDFGLLMKTGLHTGIDGASEGVCREMTDAEYCATQGKRAIDSTFAASLASASSYHTRMLSTFEAVKQAAWDAASEAEKAAYLSPSSGTYVDSSSGTSINPDSMPGGGDYGESSYSYGDSSSYSDSYSKSSYGDSYSAGSSTPTSGPGRPDYGATGGHVLRTGAAFIHQGEDIINLKKLLSGIRTGDKPGSCDIIINPTINISSNGKMSDPFEANRVADVISKRMGEELRRITMNV